MQTLKHHHTTLALFALCIVLSIVNVDSYLDRNGLCTTKERTCSPACKAIAHCEHPGDRPFERGCSGETPFCHLGQCTNVYQPDCNQDYAPMFNCPRDQDGMYPDPLDCTRFHTCLHGIPYSSDCGSHPGLVYSTKTYSCVRESNENRCGIIDCHNNTPIWATYSTDPRYASYCVNSKPMGILRCPLRYIFNVQRGKCEFKCPGEGVFPDYDDYITKSRMGDDYPLGPSYYECSLTNGLNYLVTKRNCPNDEFVKSVFVPKLSQCVFVNNSTFVPTTSTTPSPPQDLAVPT